MSNGDCTLRPAATNTVKTEIKMQKKKQFKIHFVQMHNTNLLMKTINASSSCPSTLGFRIKDANILPHCITAALLILRYIFHPSSTVLYNYYIPSKQLDCILLLKIWLICCLFLPLNAFWFHILVRKRSVFDWIKNQKNASKEFIESVNVCEMVVSIGATVMLAVVMLTWLP